MVILDGAGRAGRGCLVRPLLRQRLSAALRGNASPSSTARGRAGRGSPGPATSPPTPVARRLRGRASSSSTARRARTSRVFGSGQWRAISVKAHSRVRNNPHPGCKLSISVHVSSRRANCWTMPQPRPIECSQARDCKMTLSSLDHDILFPQTAANTAAHRAGGGVLLIRQ